MFIVLLLCAIAACYIFLKKRKRYWKDRGVITAETHPLLGTSFDFLTGRSSLEEIHDNIYAAYPNEPYVGIFNMLKPILFVRDPELIHQMTVKDFSYFHDRSPPLDGGGRLIHSVVSLAGEQWKTTRNKLMPTFSSNKLKQMYGMIESSANMLLKHHFSSAVETKTPINVREVMARFTLDVIGCCAFGLDFNSLTESDSLYRKMAILMTNTGLKNMFRNMIQFANPKLFRYTGLKMVDEEIEIFFFDLLRQAEEARKKDPNHRDDFLQLMLDIKDSEENKAQHLFSDDHIASNMFIFYFAGHETTANTLAFCLYELVLNPDIQEKLRNEITKARDANKGVLDFNSIRSISYLEMVLSETLRLHTIASISGRICTETYQLPGTSLRLEPGQLILYSLSSLHKDKQYFPNPEKFDPERFSEENVASRNPHVYLPFGDGPRICMGLRFAKLEMKICLVSILLRYRLSRCDKTEVPVILNKRSILRTAKNGIWLAVEELQA